MQSHPISRRRHLGLCGSALTGLFVARYLSAANTDSKALPNPKFQPVYDALTDQMRRLYEICRVKVDGRELLRPCLRHPRPLVVALISRGGRGAHRDYRHQLGRIPHLHRCRAG